MDSNRVGPKMARRHGGLHISHPASPISIDTEALDGIADFQGEIAAARSVESDEEREADDD